MEKTSAEDATLAAVALDINRLWNVIFVNEKREITAAIPFSRHTKTLEVCIVDVETRLSYEGRMHRGMGSQVERATFLMWLRVPISTTVGRYP